MRSFGCLIDISLLPKLSSKAAKQHLFSKHMSTAGLKCCSGRASWHKGQIVVAAHSSAQCKLLHSS